MLKIITTVLVFFIALNSYSASIEKIGDRIKLSLDSLSDEKIQKTLKKHIAQMRLKDSNEAWIISEYQKYENHLMPKNLSSNELKDFVDTTVNVNRNNDYLVKFINKLETLELSELISKIQKEGDIILSDVVIYAYVLNTMTKILGSDWQLLELTQKHWKHTRKITKLNKHLNLFEKVKVISVEYPIKRIVSFYKEQEVDPLFLNKMLPINILEAVAMDTTIRGFSNAKAGLILSKYNPAGREAKKTLPMPYARFSEQTNKIALGIPHSEKWADLYGIWNLAFVSHYKHFPYLMTKLLIPQLADHYGKSNEYIHNRAVSLYVHAHFALLGRLDGDKYLANNLNWYSKELYHGLGKSSLSSAKEYESEVK